MLTISRIFRISLAITLAASFVLSTASAAPLNSPVGAPIVEKSTPELQFDADGPTDPVNPFAIDPYPDYIEVNQEDRREEAQAMMESYPDDQTGIQATSDYTVTLGAWRNLRPTESYLWDVSMLPPEYPVDCSQNSRGWIVGDAGTILGYCNGIWDHHISVQSRFTRLWGVQAISPTLSVAVGEEGAILIYLWDHIAQDWEWTKSPISVGNQTLYHVSMVPDGIGNYVGWAIGAADSLNRGTLIRGTIVPIIRDGHNTFDYQWTNQTDNFDLPPVLYFYGLQMLTATNGWASGGTPGSNGVFIHWNGQEWSLFQEVPGNPVHALHMRSPTDGWAGGLGGELYHFNGSTWSQVASPTTNELVDIDFDEDGIGWAIGQNGTMLRYANGEWSLFTDLRTDPIEFRALDYTSGHGWMVGRNPTKEIGGQILEYDEGLWLAVTPPTDNALNDIAVISDNDAWAVGAADNMGGTIIHWDGRHWQRWYQKDLPLPPVDLYAINMVSSRNGWAAGDSPSPGEKAVLLHWDGHRWAPTRYDSPINVRINDISMLDEDFGWATASDGNAVAKFDGFFDYWSANHTCQGLFYNLRSVSVVPNATSPFGWDAWSVGTGLNPATGEHFMRYMDGCTGFAWQPYQPPLACPPPPDPPDPDDGWQATTLHTVQMDPEMWGYAGGNYKSRASVYYYDDTYGYWDTIWCHPDNIGVTPSQIYSVDIVENSGVAWFGGYYFSQLYNRKVAFIQYKDATGFNWAGNPFPINGVNIYDRPIRAIDMSSNTMGWAVGDPEDPGKRSVIYQYPYPNFTLDINPESRAVRPGEATDYTIEANSIGGFSADVNLSILSLPLGVTGDITPATISAGTPATFHIQTSPTTPLGTHYILLEGYSVFTSGDWDIPVWRVATLKLNVTNHPIYSISPEKAPAATVVTIAGANFGADPGVGNRSTPQNHVTWAGVQLPDANINSWSDTQIRFTPPDDPALFDPLKFPLLGDVIVMASGENSNDDLTFQIEPYISSLQSVPNSDRMLVTLHGTSFGSDPGSLNRDTVYEHISIEGVWISNYDVASWSNHEIQFFVDMTTHSGLVVVTSNGYESNPVPYYAPGQEEDNLVYLPMLRR